MKRSSAFLVIWLGAIVSCVNVGAAENQDDVLVKYHFIGTENFQRDTNYSLLAKVLTLTNAETIRNDLIDKLAGSTAELIKAGTTSAEQQALLRPVWRDLLQKESYAEWRQPAGQQPTFILAARLSNSEAGTWTKNLSAAVAGWGLTPATDEQGWEAALPNGSSLRWHQQGDWGILAFGPKKFAESHSWWRQIKDGKPPETASEDLEWFTTTINWPRLAQWIPQPLGYFKPMQMKLALRVKGGLVRSQAELHYPEPIAWKSGRFEVPTNIVAFPMSSFSAVNDLSAFLEPSPVFKEFGLDPFASTAYFWGQLGFQSFFLIQNPDPEKYIADHEQSLPALCNRYLSDWKWGWVKYVASRKAFEGAGIPAVIAWLSATNDGPRHFLRGEVFPPPPKTEAMPGPLLAQVEGQENLVLYDWEVTERRLEQWRFLRGLLPIFHNPSPAHLIQTDETHDRLKTEQQFLGNLSSLLGESVTEVRRTSPSNFLVTRKSYCGFTSIELVYLLHWLSDPGFPVGKMPPGAGSDPVRSASGTPGLPPAPAAPSPRRPE